MDLATVGRRLDSLERSRRTWRRSACLMCVVAVAAVAWGADRKDEASEVVRTRRLEIVNEKGGLVASHGATTDYFDSRGKLVLRVGVDGNEGASISIKNHNATTTVFLGSVDESGSIATFSKRDKMTASISSGKDGDGVMLIKDRNEKTVWSAPE
jgi:hypothetical protein